MIEGFYEQTEKISRIIIILTIALSYTFIGLIYFFSKDSINFSTTWAIQFKIIALFSAAITSFTVLNLRRASLYIIFTLNIICKYLISKPFTQFIWFESLFIVIIFLSAILTLNNKEILIVSMILLMFSVFPNRDNIYWGRKVEARPLEISLFIILFIILLTFLSIIIKFLNNIVNRQKNIITDQNNIIKKLTAANSGLQQYANLSEEKSVNSERMRITREIHDSVGYTMTNLLMMIEASTDLIDVNSHKLRELLNNALQIIREGHKDMRLSLRALRNTKVIKSNSLKIFSNLSEIFSSSTGVIVNLEYGNIPWNIPPEEEQIIYRFIQEGMTNSLTHGEAKQIDIHFRVDDGRIFVNIIDDGNGCRDIKKGIGLNGMEERLKDVGGVLEYGNLHRGFSAKINIPLGFYE